MPRVLITGMSGTGKSTLLAELASRGHRVVDTDEGEWTREVRDSDGLVINHVWNEAAITPLLDSFTDVIVSGCVSNQGRFRDRFAAVVLLSVDESTVRHRLATRATNDFGKDPVELDAVLRDLATVEPLLRATATVELDGTRRVDDLADAVEGLIASSTGAP